jgi:multicomponent Na+:H+ antiporter subunit E
MPRNESRPTSAPLPGSATPATGSSWMRTAGLIVILSAFWLLLSGRIGLQYLLFMAFSVGIVILMNPERPFGSRAPGLPSGGRELVRSSGAFVRYLVWLLRAVVVANLDVARRILDPRMPIRPKLMVFRTELQSDVAQVMVANTITLTPGTVTVDLQDGTYLVHALHPDTADAVVSGELQNTVAPIFGEPREKAPEVRWAFSPLGLRAEKKLVPEDVALAEAEACE